MHSQMGAMDLDTWVVANWIYVPRGLVYAHSHICILFDISEFMFCAWNDWEHLFMIRTLVLFIDYESNIQLLNLITPPGIQFIHLFFTQLMLAKYFLYSK